MADTLWELDLQIEQAEASLHMSHDDVERFRLDSALNQLKQERFYKLKDYTGAPLTDVDIRNTAIDTTTSRDAVERAVNRRVAGQRADQPWQIIYGETRVRGTITFITLDEGDAGKWLHLINTYCGHEVYRLEAVYFDGVLFTHSQNANNVFYPNTAAWGNGLWYIPGGAFDSDSYAFISAETLGTRQQAANSHAVSQSTILFPGKWTVDHRQQGRAHAYHIFYFNKERYPNTFPPVIEYQVKGKKIYDPRDVTQALATESTWKWSNNAALICADYISNADFGMADSNVLWGASGSEVGSVWWAANICDEVVSTIAGTEKRYTIDGAFTLGAMDHQTVLTEFAKAIGGAISDIGGTWYFFPGKYVAPTLTLTEDDLLTTLSIDVLSSRRTLFNSVQGRYKGPATEYELTDYPSVSNSYYLSQDGAPLSYALDLPFTDSPARAQRLAKIVLENARQAITFDVLASLRAFSARVNDNIAIAKPSLGWLGKIFRIERHEFVATPEQYAVRLFLRETAPGVTDYSNGEETTFDLAPNSNLPIAGTNIRNPTNLQVDSGTDVLYRRLDGTIFSRLHVTWDAPGDPVSWGGGTEIQYKLSSSATWVFHAVVPNGQTETFILDVQDGELYDVRARSVTSVGVASQTWLNKLFHRVEGKTDKPSDVTNLRAQVGSFGILLFWDAVLDPDLLEYHVYENGVFQDNPSSTQFKLDTRAAGVYTFQVYAIDTSKNQSLLPATLVVTIAGPSIPDVSFQIVGPDVVFSWEPVVVNEKQFAIKEYIIVSGVSFEAGEEIGRVKSSGFGLRVTWKGNQTFWVAAVDEYGNIGVAAREDVQIMAPGIVNHLRVQVIRNNMIFRFDSNPGTLPITKYRLYKGETFALAQAAGPIGNAFATIIFHMESIAGRFIYWITQIDSAENEGLEVGLPTTVNTPVDFILRADEILLPVFSNTSNLLVGVSSGFIGGFDATQIANLKLWLNASNDSSITYDSTRRVSNIDDSGPFDFDFSQATQAAKPLLSRSDNKENLFLNSDTMTGAEWLATRCSIIKLTTLTPTGHSIHEVIEDSTTSSTHFIRSLTPVVIDRQYRVSIVAKAAERYRVKLAATSTLNSGQPGAIFDLLSGMVVSDTSGFATIVSLGQGYFRCSIIATCDATGNGGADIFLVGADGSITYSGNGSSKILAAQPQISEVEADDEYIITTGERKVRGVNNASVLIFDGVDDVLASVGTFNDVIKNNEFTIFLVSSPNGITKNTGTAVNDDGIFGGNAGKIGLSYKTIGPSIQAVHKDATSIDEIESLVNANELNIAHFRHEGGNIYLSVDGAIESSVASGNTELLTGTLRIGQTSVGFGAIRFAELLVFDRALSSAEVEKIERYLQLKWQDAPAYFSADINEIEMLGPVDTQQTWEEHFGQALSEDEKEAIVYVMATSNATLTDSEKAYLMGILPISLSGNEWGTIQEQIDAGFPIYIQPALQGAHFEQILDYSTDLPPSIISFTWKEERVVGNVIVVPSIGYALEATPNDFTMVVGESQVFAQRFRFVKVVLNLTSPDTKSLVKISTPRVRLDAELSRDSGTVYCLASDMDGTPFSFNLDYIDVQEPPSGNYVGGDKLAYPVIIFDDVVNPTGGKAKLYDIDPNSLNYGLRIDGLVKWGVNGFTRTEA